MSPRWHKLGRVFELPAGGLHPKLLSHTANPLPVLLEGDVYRVFYSARDAENRSSVGAVDIDVVRAEVVRVHAEPFFLHGPAGSFYEAGVSIGCVHEAQGQRWLLFMGWQQPAGGHWRGDIGALTLTSELTLSLASETPWLASDPTDPVSLSYPWVLPMPQGGWRMWYGSTVTWDAGNREMLHVINGATSQDGVHWQREGLSVPFQIGVAQAFSRPSVVRNPDGSHDMWFSYRSGSGTPYRIGRASSHDGVAWRLRLDESGIDVSAEGWDAQMIEYPYVWDHAGRRLMLYNGDGFGKTGFGLAEMRAGPDPSISDRP